jgi:hypothetical protein
MTDDIYHEKLITLPQAAAMLPRKRGKRVHVSTIYRWMNGGVKGVRLEYCEYGGTRYTSVPAMRRFSQRIAQRKVQSGAAIVSSPRSSKRAGQDNARAKKALQHMKVLPAPASKPERPIARDASAPARQNESPQRS